MPQQTLPRHVAIIMDGNGRWAKLHKFQVAMGHKKGVEALRNIIRESSDLHIHTLSLFAFSTENWSRSEQEVSALMALLLQYFKSEIDELDEKNVKIRIIGDVNGLPIPQRNAVLNAEERTKNNTGLNLLIALNYGGQQEIVRACKILAQKVQDKEITPDDINKEMFQNALYTRNIPEVDLLIRTSNEQRLSGFMLFQCAYAEFLFPDVLWPDFTVKDFHDALDSFGRRDRRFGGRKA